MSSTQSSSLNNYIDISSIKNTKLFQKFIQNKSGLVNKNKLNSDNLITNIPNNNSIAHSQQIKQNHSNHVNIINVNRQQHNNSQIQYENNKKNISDLITDKEYNYGVYQHEDFPIQKATKIKHSPIKTIQSHQYNYTSCQKDKFSAQTYQSKQVQQSKVQSYDNNDQHHKLSLKEQSNRNNNNRRRRQFQVKSTKQQNKNNNNNIDNDDNGMFKEETFGRKWNNRQIQTTKSTKQIEGYQQYQTHVVYQQPSVVNNNNVRLMNAQKSNNNNQDDTENLGYKAKYEKLLLKYEDMKRDMKNENKTRKMQLNEWQQQIEIIKEKLYEVQSREDSLVIENQRLKEKYEYEVNLKTKAQEEAKQLGYKVKQLEDMLNMRQVGLKQKSDEANYWKSQVDTIKGQNNSLKISLEKKYDQYNMLSGDYHIIKKERDHKDYLIEDLRKNVAGLVEENGVAKDQLFSLVTKLYQMEQENQTLKADLKRQMDSSTVNYANMRQRIQSFNYQKPDRMQPVRLERYEPVRPYEKVEIQKQSQRKSFTQHQKPQTNTERPIRGARGEFARERGHLNKNQRPERAPKQNLNKSIDEPKRQVQRPLNSTKVNRIQEISEQLQKIKDMKAMNGAIRRRKIELERQLQQLQSQQQQH